MPAEDYDAFLASGLQPDLDKQYELLNSVQSDELRFPVAALARNMDNIMHLLMLPVSFAAGGPMASQVAGAAAAMAVAKFAGKASRDPKALTAEYMGPVFHDAFKEAGERFEKKLTEDAVRTEILALAKQAVLEAVEKNEGAGRSFRSLLCAAVPMAWSTFECTARDVWIAAVNARPKCLWPRLIGKTYEARPREERRGSPGLNLSVDMLEKYGTDIGAHITHILAEDFKFSSLDGIRKAYRAAFGSESEFGTFLGDEGLLSLEKLRHLLVHTGGIVDEKFASEYRLFWNGDLKEEETIRPGTEITPSVSAVEGFVEVATHASVGLICAADKWLIDTCGRKG